MGRAARKKSLNAAWTAGLEGVEHHVVFSEESVSALSHVFTVTDHTWIVKGAGLPSGLVVEVDMVVRRPAGPLYAPLRDPAGNALQITPTKPLMALPIEGQFRARIVSGTPGSFALVATPAGGNLGGDLVQSPAVHTAPIATTLRRGIVELATSAETITGTDDQRAVTPYALSQRTSTAARTGLIELATGAEVALGEDQERAITPATLLSRTATTDRAGIVELATSAETIAGTDATRAVTPAGLATLTATDARRGLVELANDNEVLLGVDTARAVTPAGLAAMTGNVRTFATRAAAMLIAIPLVVNSVQVLGYDAVWDEGAATYKRVSAPVSPKTYHWQDASGNWWEYDGGSRIDVRAFGAKADWAVDSTAAINDAIEWNGTRGGGVVYIARGVWKISLSEDDDSLDLSTYRQCALSCPYDYVTIEGDGPGATIVKLAEGAIYGALQYLETPLQNGVTKIYGSGFRNITWHGNYDQSSGSFSVGFPLVYFVGCADATFDNFELVYSSHYGGGVQNGGHFNLKFTRGFVGWTGQDGIDVKNTASLNAGLVFDTMTFYKCGRGYAPSTPFACLDIDSVGTIATNILVLAFPDDEIDTGSGIVYPTVHAGVRWKQGVDGDRLDRGDGTIYGVGSGIVVKRQESATSGDVGVAVSAAHVTLTGVKVISAPANPIGTGIEMQQPASLKGCSAENADIGLNVRHISGPGATTRTATISIANPAVFSAVAHGLIEGDAVRLLTTGALPTGFETGTIYYVISAGLTADAFRLAAYKGGPAIASSGSQSGVHTVSGPIEAFLYIDGAIDADIDGFTARNCGTGVYTNRARTRLSSPFLDSCDIGIHYDASDLSGTHTNATFRRCAQDMRIRSTDVPSAPTMLGKDADGSIVQFRRTEKQYTEIIGNSSGQFITSYSDPANAKPTFINSTTFDGTVPTSGDVALHLQVLDETKFKVLRSGAFQNTNSAMIVDPNGAIWLRPYTAAEIAAIGNAVNTANKGQGKAIYDSTNKRVMVADGSSAAAAWYRADGQLSVTPTA